MGLEQDDIERMAKACAEAYQEEQAQAKQVAETILQQLGNGFIGMTGAKAFVFRSGEPFGLGALQFKLPSNPFNAKGINHVSIVLDANDTYTMTFSKKRKAFVRKGIRYDAKETIYATHTNVYCDELQRIFTNETNLLVSLFPRIGEGKVR